MDSLDISLIVTYHRDCTYLERLLESLNNSDIHDFKHEVLIIASPQAERPKSILPFEFVETKHSAIGPKKNLGLKKAKGQILFYFDDDTFLEDRSFFTKVLSHFNNENLIAIGGHYHSPAGSTDINRAYNQLVKNYLEAQKAPFSLLGGNFAIRKGAKATFDESQKFGSVEDKLFHELKGQGQILYDRAMVINHESRMGLISLVQKAWLQGKHQSLTHGGPSLKTKAKLLFASPRELIPFLLIYHLINKLARVF